MEIYRFYVSLLRDCPDAEIPQGYYYCKEQLKKTLGL